VSVEQAAKELGMQPQGVREHMKRGYLDIGNVLPVLNKKKNGSRKYSYYIYREKLDRVLGHLQNEVR